MPRHSRVILILFAILVLAALAACDDWDGIDRSDWPATSTASAQTEMALATADASATRTVEEVRR